MNTCEVIERPILFSAPMVRAILNGSKTQTRRVIDRKLMPDKGMSSILCPFGLPGDRLWVRETWADVRGQGFDNDLFPVGVSYKAECDAESLRIASEYRVKWKPSIHMPRWASRITLEITAVWVERLQDMSDEDAEAEGIWEPCNCTEGCDICAKSLLEDFASLWDSIAKPGFRWNDNPFVWVIQFKRL